MVTEATVRKGLQEVVVPGATRNLEKLGLVRGVAISGKKVKITLASTALNNEAQAQVKARAQEVVSKLPDVGGVEIEFVEVRPSEINQINYVVAIMSGKGGVGKSLVSSLMAIALKRQGLEVGILDADITGPSIPRMFGIATRAIGSHSGILPVVSRTGIEVISMNLLLRSGKSLL